jgi:hypothetical protein
MRPLEWARFTRLAIVEHCRPYALLIRWGIPNSYLGMINYFAQLGDLNYLIWDSWGKATGGRQNANYVFRTEILYLIKKEVEVCSNRIALTG